SAATLLWWFSEPGLVNALSLRVMFLCSVSTVLFNANPLARADGYYILSDLIGVPNLWQESRDLWSRAAWSWLTGLEMPVDSRIRPLAPWLMLYAAASMLYRWLLIGGILWFCFKVLEPHGLSAAWWLLAPMVFIGLVTPPVRGAVEIFSQARLRRRV